MFNFYIKKLFISFLGFTTFNFIFFFIGKLHAEYLTNLKVSDSNPYLKKNFEKFEYKLNNILKKEFLGNRNVVNFFASNTLQEPIQKFVEIESNIKYQQDGIFYAEGDVIILISNAKLAGDKASYDELNKNFTIEGNVEFFKGDQYFEASKLVYNFKTGMGYLNDVYGVINGSAFDKDFQLKAVKDKNKYIFKDEGKSVRDLNYINTTKFGFENDTEKDKRLNITDLDLDIPSINKWRFKSDKLLISPKKLSSKIVYFTNDPFNKPQFILQSRNFSAEIIEDKIKFVSRNSWINLDDKLNLPIGRWTIFDDDPISKWSIGSDYKEKDGFYLSRSFEGIDINKDFTLRIQPYYLIQRSIKGKTKSFRAKDSSILSDKVENNKSFSDNFALDTQLIGKIKDWDLNIKTNTNTLNFERFSEANRAKLSLNRSFDLKERSNESNQADKKNNLNENLIDFQISTVFREKVPKGYSGEEEIYYSSSISVVNKKSWELLDNNLYTSLVFDYGDYKGKSSIGTELDKSFRSALAYSIDYKFPIYENKNSEEEINQSFKYTPKIIKPGVFWDTNIDAGIFLYDNNFSQKAISFNSGPIIRLGKFQKNFFDFTKLSSKITYVSKSGESPFAFDDINKDTRINIDFEQQLIGPLIFGYESYLPLSIENPNYGEFIDSKLKLGINRRAYSINAFYEPSEKVFGFQFNIFNFNYLGNSSKF